MSILAFYLSCWQHQFVNTTDLVLLLVYKVLLLCRPSLLCHSLPRTAGYKSITHITHCLLRFPTRPGESAHSSCPTAAVTLQKPEANSSPGPPWARHCLRYIFSKPFFTAARGGRTRRFVAGSKWCVWSTTGWSHYSKIFLFLWKNI